MLTPLTGYKISSLTYNYSKMWNFFGFSGGSGSNASGIGASTNARSEAIASSIAANITPSRSHSSSDKDASDGRKEVVASTVATASNASNNSKKKKKNKNKKHSDSNTSTVAAIGQISGSVIDSNSSSHHIVDSANSDDDDDDDDKYDVAILKSSSSNNLDHIHVVVGSDISKAEMTKFSGNQMNKADPIELVIDDVIKVSNSRGLSFNRATISQCVHKMWDAGLNYDDTESIIDLLKNDSATSSPNTSAKFKKKTAENSATIPKIVPKSNQSNHSQPLDTVVVTSSSSNIMQLPLSSTIGANEVVQSQHILPSNASASQVLEHISLSTESSLLETIASCSLWIASQRHLLGSCKAADELFFSTTCIENILFRLFKGTEKSDDVYQEMSALFNTLLAGYTFDNIDTKAISQTLVTQIKMLGTSIDAINKHIPSPHEVLSKLSKRVATTISNTWRCISCEYDVNQSNVQNALKLSTLNAINKSIESTKQSLIQQKMADTNDLKSKFMLRDLGISSLELQISALNEVLGNKDYYKQIGSNVVSKSLSSQHKMKSYDGEYKQLEDALLHCRKDVVKSAAASTVPTSSATLKPLEVELNNCIMAVNQLSAEKELLLQKVKSVELQVQEYQTKQSVLESSLRSLSAVNASAAAHTMITSIAADSRDYKEVVSTIVNGIKDVEDRLSSIICAKPVDDTSIFTYSTSNTNRINDIIENINGYVTTEGSCISLIVERIVLAMKKVSHMEGEVTAYKALNMKNMIDHFESSMTQLKSEIVEDTEVLQQLQVELIDLISKANTAVSSYDPGAVAKAVPKAAIKSIATALLRLQLAPLPQITAWASEA